ncbi:hypothetical protein GGE35_002950 [Rhizobium cellulosilyticum]|uniref:Uncharacterized protein n=1 Tax=Aliirhizobium cellulosilyticum TaxID=393664 RepID=A0A7W6XB68_9HYPH|nr:hypothetical protein [Rhizobium cellulosilyticum]MBB4412496.1 hypothetical protein [Rhizobium cellulosilyticum]MBB4447128.1 hypothetical protein [Rhizobium cellulosilyticum]
MRAYLSFGPDLHNSCSAIHSRKLSSFIVTANIDNLWIVVSATHVDKNNGRSAPDLLVEIETFRNAFDLMNCLFFSGCCDPKCRHCICV